MVIVGGVLVALVVGVWKFRRHTTLAGRNAEKPTYMVERPPRSVGNRRTEVL